MSYLLSDIFDLIHSILNVGWDNSKYHPTYFKDTNEMKIWIIERTMFLVKELTNSDTKIKIRFKKFKPIQYLNNNKIEVIGGRNVSVRIKAYGIIIKRNLIMYNLSAFEGMCKQCIDETLIHEVTHINTPHHNQKFYNEFYCNYFKYHRLDKMEISQNCTHCPKVEISE